MNAVNHNKSLPIPPKSEKARQRRELILDAVESILASVPIEELGIQEVSRRTGLPSQAIYRLFPSPRALTHGLAERHLAALREQQDAATVDEAASWQEKLETGLEQVAAYYNANPQAMKLILGSGVSREIRAADRENVARMAAPLFAAFEHGIEPHDRAAMALRMELAVDIVDAIWSHSYFLHERIEPFFIAEGHRAMVGYLELYFGRYSSARISPAGDT